MNLGPLEPLLQDPTLWSIMVNGTDPIYVSRKAFVIEETDQRFESMEQLMGVMHAIAEPMGQRIDESHPIVESRLQDGTRVTIVIPPIALNGPVMHLYLPIKAENMLDWETLIQMGSIGQTMHDFLTACVRARVNIAVSGGTGSGKTTLLNLLSNSANPEHRLIIVQDEADIVVNHANHVRLEARPANLEGLGGITQAQLIETALKLSPQRIICTEVKDKEAYPLLESMNSGLDGSMFAIHANGVQDTLTRLEMFCSAAQPSFPLLTIRRLIASALDLIVQVDMQKDGRRRVLKLSEVVGMDGHTILTEDIFEFVSTDEDDTGKLIGEFRPTGYKPGFLHRFKKYGEPLPDSLFTDT